MVRSGGAPLAFQILTNGQVWAPKYGPPWSVHHHNWLSKSLWLENKG